MLHFLANVAFRYKFVALAQSVEGQGFYKQKLYKFVAFKYKFVALRYRFVVVKCRLAPWLSHFASRNIEI